MIKNQQGICRHCRRRVQLIYPGGQTLGSLVIGPHHGLVTKESAVSGKLGNCPGAGRLPVEANTAAQK